MELAPTTYLQRSRQKAIFSAQATSSSTTPDSATNPSDGRRETPERRRQRAKVGALKARNAQHRQRYSGARWFGLADARRDSKRPRTLSVLAELDPGNNVDCELVASSERDLLEVTVCDGAEQATRRPWARFETGQVPAATPGRPASLGCCAGVKATLNFEVCATLVFAPRAWSQGIGGISP
jgi:hypothetical protein